MHLSPCVIIALTEVFEGIEGTIPSKIILPLTLNLYLKKSTSFLILFSVKNFEEKEIQFSKEWFYQKLWSNDDNRWALFSGLLAF